MVDATRDDYKQTLEKYIKEVLNAIHYNDLYKIFVVITHCDNVDDFENSEEWQEEAKNLKNLFCDKYQLFGIHIECIYPDRNRLKNFKEVFDEACRELYFAKSKRKEQIQTLTLLSENENENEKNVKASSNSCFR